MRVTMPKRPNEIPRLTEDSTESSLKLRPGPETETSLKERGRSGKLVAPTHPLDLLLKHYW